MVRDEAFLHHSPRESFERALAAFDGAPADFPSFDARKMMDIVSSSTGADTTLDRDGLSVLWPGRPEPFHYLPGLGPSVVASLRAVAPGGSFDCAFDLDKPTLATLCRFGHAAPMRFWVSRSEDRITILCRAATAEQASSSVPSPLRPWTPPSRVFASHHPPRKCVHCDVAPVRFRLTEDALICLACGRSRSVQPHDLEGATLQTEPAPPRPTRVRNRDRR